MKRHPINAACGLGLALLLAPAAVGAAEPAGSGNTDQRLDQLQKQIDELRAQLDRQKSAERPEAVQEKKDTWHDRVKLSGDLRLRFENIEKPSWNTGEDRVNDRERIRARARLGLDAKINDEVDARLRIATGDGDPVSTNQTLTDEFTKKPIWLDIAQISYRPVWAGSDKDRPLEIIGGKMEVPFHRPGKSELLWDGDLTPEGLAIKWNPKINDVDLMFTLGGFSTMERKADRDAALFGAQGAIKLNLLEKKAYILAGLGNYDFIHVEGRDLFDFEGVGSSYGNTANGALYQYDYNELEFFAEAGYLLEVLERRIPLVAFVDMVSNRAEDVDEDEKGWMVGGSIGRLKDPGDLALSYNYRVLEKNAVVGAFTDSDSWGGGTDGKGHKFSLEVQLMKNVSAGLAFFMDEANISDRDAEDTEQDYRRLQLDIGVRF